MGYAEKKAELGLAYGILDSPTWFGALFYGIQVNLSKKCINLTVYFSIFLHLSPVSSVRHWLLSVYFVLMVTLHMDMLFNQKLSVPCFLQLVLELFSKLL